MKRLWFLAVLLIFTFAAGPGLQRVLAQAASGQNEPPLATTNDTAESQLDQELDDQAKKAQASGDENKTPNDADHGPQSDAGNVPANGAANTPETASGSGTPVPSSQPAPATVNEAGNSNPEPAPAPASADPDLARAGAGPPKTEIAQETANLLKLANRLKAEVDKTTKDTLSVTVVREAAEIEQLAHKLRTK